LDEKFSNLNGKFSKEILGKKMELLEVKSSINQIKISMESITDSKRKNNKD
jgi:hypothetical protein